MPYKDHLPTLESNRRRSSRQTKAVLASAFTASPPAITETITDTGINVTAPSGTKDYLAPFLDDIDDLSENIATTIEINLDQIVGRFHRIQLPDVAAITINLLGLVRNKAEEIFLDFTKENTLNTPTVTFNPPINGLNQSDLDSNDRLFVPVMGRDTEDEVRFDVFGAAGSSTGAEPTVLRNLNEINFGDVGLTSVVVDWDLANFHRMIVSETPTVIGFLNEPVSGKWEKITIQITQDTPGLNTVTFSDTFVNGAPTVKTGAGEITVLDIYSYHDGVSNIFYQFNPEAGGSQTPWVSNINAATFELGNLGRVLFNKATGIVLTATDTGVISDANGGLNYNLSGLSGQYNFVMNADGSPRLQINNTSVVSQSLFPVDPTVITGDELGASGNEWARLSVTDIVLKAGADVSKLIFDGDAATPKTYFTGSATLGTVHFFSQIGGVATNIINLTNSNITLFGNTDLILDTGQIRAGGAGKGMENIGHLDFVDNLATPIAAISLYSDGTDLFSKSGINLNINSLTAVDALQIVDTGGTPRGTISGDVGATALRVATASGGKLIISDVITDIAEFTNATGLTILGTHVINMGKNVINTIGETQFDTTVGFNPTVATTIGFDTTSKFLKYNVGLITDVHAWYAAGELLAGISRIGASSGQLTIDAVVGDILQANEQVFFGDSATDPTVNGEMRRNGIDVKVFSGGALRNLSDIGSGSEVFLWTAPHDADGNAFITSPDGLTSFITATNGEIILDRNATGPTTFTLATNNATNGTTIANIHFKALDDGTPTEVNYGRIRSTIISSAAGNYEGELSLWLPAGGTMLQRYTLGATEILPVTDGTYHLGGVSNHWQDIYTKAVIFDNVGEPALLSASTTYIFKQTTNLWLNVPTGDGMILGVQNVSKLGVGVNEINLQVETNFNDNKGINVLDPTGPQDIATKKYVDDNSGGAGLQDGEIWITHETTQFDFEVYHCNSKVGSEFIANSLAEDTLTFVPFFLGERARLVRMGFETHSVTGNSTIRFGIYTNRTDGQNYPQTKLDQNGSVFAGVGTHSSIFAEDLEAGLYWLAILNTTNTTLVVKSLQEGECNTVGYEDNGGSGFDPINGYVAVETSTTLPTTVDNEMLSISTVVPAVFVKLNINPN